MMNKPKIILRNITLVWFLYRKTYGKIFEICSNKNRSETHERQHFQKEEP